MNELKKQFADRLLAADTPSPGARGRYEKEIHAMLEKTLTARQRGLYLAGAVLLALLAAFFGISAIAPLPPDAEYIKYVWVVFVATALVLLIAAGIFFAAYWKGVIRLSASRSWATGLGVAYVGLAGWLFLLMARHIPEILRDDVRVFGLVLLVYAAVAWIRHRVAQEETRTAEKLLEIELRLAEIGEALQARSQPAHMASPAQPPPA